MWLLFENPREDAYIGRHRRIRASTPPLLCNCGVNPLYRDMLAHHGVVGLPARVRHPDRKGKVERAALRVQRREPALVARRKRPRRR